MERAAQVHFAPACRRVITPPQVGPADFSPPAYVNRRPPMHYRRLSLLAFFAVSLAALAQQPQSPSPQPQTPPLDPNNKLDATLLSWEKAMGGISSLYTEVKQQTTDKVRLSIDNFTGEARYLKPNKASLYLKNDKKPADFQYLIINGQNAYKFEPTQKEIHIYTLPAAKQGQISDENLVSMLFGMKAVEAKRRYEMQLTKEDQWYFYIQVLPREAQDKADFTRAELVLTKSTSMPRRIWFENPNGNETTWEFTKLQPNVVLKTSDFDQPAPPKEWQLKRIAPQDPQGPRVVRPQQ
jgi:TIGR03009 family protein